MSKLHIEQLNKGLELARRGLIVMRTRGIHAFFDGLRRYLALRLQPLVEHGHVDQTSASQPIADHCEGQSLSRNRSDLISPDQKLHNRNRLSQEYIRGEGIEIGAANCPLWIPEGAKVKYVDTLTTQEIREKFTYIQDDHYVPEVEIVDDGETLDSIPEESIDFIVANHFFEHCENPLAALKAHLSKLRHQGIIYYAIPDKRYTFDSSREITEFEHVLRDYEEGPETSMRQHYLDWALKVCNAKDMDSAEQMVAAYVPEHAKIHFHVWDAESFVSFISRAQLLFSNSFYVEQFLAENENEFIVILRKRIGNSGVSECKANVIHAEPVGQLNYISELQWNQHLDRLKTDRVLANRHLNDLEIACSIDRSNTWPKTLVLNLSSQCNNLCRFCGQTEFHKRFSVGGNLAFLDCRKLERIFRDVEVGWPTNVDLQGDGEPLIQKDFREVYSFCREKFPESAIRICTNGLALNRAMSDFLITGKVGWVNISLNAGSSAVYETVCGSKRFDRIVENVRYLVQLMRQRGEAVPAIGMSYVLARYNLGDLENFVRLLADLGIRSAQVHYMTSVSHEMLAESVIHEKQRTNEALDRVHLLAEELGVHVQLPERFHDAETEDPIEPPTIRDFDFRSAKIQLAIARRKATREGITPKCPQAGLKDLTKVKMVERQPAMRCTYPWDFLSLAGDGAAQMCCGGIGYEDGNALEQGFWSVWNGPIRKFLRRTVNSGSVPKICDVCPLNKVRDVTLLETHARPEALV